MAGGIEKTLFFPVAGCFGPGVAVVVFRSDVLFREPERAARRKGQDKIGNIHVQFQHQRPVVQFSGQHGDAAVDLLVDFRFDQRFDEKGYHGHEVQSFFSRVSGQENDS